MSQSQKNILVVGSGIAGSTLAYYLVESGFKVTLLSSKNKERCSNIAAGLFNPIVFKRYTQSWMADIILPHALNFYETIEELTATKFLNQPHFLKIISNEIEEGEINKAKQKPHYANWIEETTITQIEGINAKQLLKIKNAGWVNIPKYLSALSDFLNQNLITIEEDLNYDSLTFSNEKIFHKDIPYDKIVFCEGSSALNNPYFKEEFFNFCKGEILTIHSPNLNLESIINKGIFIIPLAENSYRVGATYIWNDYTKIPTENGIKELKEKLDNLINVPYTIIETVAGIRPTVKDRRPILGESVSHKNIYIFNGLGTKGVLLAPYFANELTRNLL